jgi:hypothetical protein
MAPRKGTTSPVAEKLNRQGALQQVHDFTAREKTRLNGLRNKGTASAGPIRSAE